MRVAYAAVLLLLLTGGCARAKPDMRVSEPQTVATQPDAPRSAAKPVTLPAWRQAAACLVASRRSLDPRLARRA